MSLLYEKNKQNLIVSPKKQKHSIFYGTQIDEDGQNESSDSSDYTRNVTNSQDINRDKQYRSASAHDDITSLGDEHTIHLSKNKKLEVIISYIHVFQCCVFNL